jgi:signal recognition particle receptor subunit beta
VVFFNYTTMQMTAKIVYYGPGLCGKTTNLQAIHHRTAPKSRGEMVSLETETDRTLFFDLLPLEVGVIGGMKVRLQLYTVPGQVFYNATRKLVLKGVDGVVFVADSQVAALETNQESLKNLKVNLAELGLGFEQIPVIFQYNKRDIRNIVSIEALNQTLNPGGAPHFEAAALHGIGVFETLKAISRLAIASVRKKLAPEEPAPRLAAAAPPPAPAASAKPAPERPVERRPAVPAPADANPLEALVSGDAPAVEFAQEDTDKHVVPVTTKGQVDIHQELEKLRALTGAPAPRSTAAPASREMERRLQDMLGTDQGARQDLKRKASLELPAELLKSAEQVRIQLSFDRDGETESHEALTIRLGPNRRLERITLHLDLDVKGKG